MKIADIDPVVELNDREVLRNTYSKNMRGMHDSHRLREFVGKDCRRPVFLHQQEPRRFHTLVDARLSRQRARLSEAEDTEASFRADASPAHSLRAGRALL